MIGLRKIIRMKVFSNPSKRNSNLIELTDSELAYLTAYIKDLSSYDRLKFPVCFYRAAKFSHFYNILIRYINDKKGLFYHHP